LVAKCRRAFDAVRNLQMFVITVGSLDVGLKDDVSNRHTGFILREQEPIALVEFVLRVPVGPRNSDLLMIRSDMDSVILPLYSQPILTE